MKTAKNVSNICYYTADYLGFLLAQLRTADAIGPCYWIAHKGEDGDKDHIHIVFLGGVRTYNTEQLSGLFLPQVRQDGVKAGMTVRWTATKSLDDWLLYAVHEPTYLLRKGQVKQVSYRWDDVKCLPQDSDLLAHDIASAKSALEQGADKVYRILRFCARQRMSWRDILRAGLLPIGVLGNAYQVYDAICKGEIVDLAKDDNSKSAESSAVRRSLL